MNTPTLERLPVVGKEQSHNRIFFLSTKFVSELEALVQGVLLHLCISLATLQFDTEMLRFYKYLHYKMYSIAVAQDCLQILQLVVSFLIDSL